jgi:hypothetical protein
VKEKTEKFFMKRQDFTASPKKCLDWMDDLDCLEFVTAAHIFNIDLQSQFSAKLSKLCPKPQEQQSTSEDEFTELNFSHLVLLNKLTLVGSLCETATTWKCGEMCEKSWQQEVKKWGKGSRPGRRNEKMTKNLFCILLNRPRSAHHIPGNFFAIPENLDWWELPA